MMCEEKEKTMMCEEKEEVDWEEFAESEGVVIQSKIQTSVGHVEACPFGDDRYEDLIGEEYYMYGLISATDYPVNPPIILFNRDREHAHFIRIKDPLHGFVPLSDHRLSSDRPLDHPRTALYLTFKLHIVVKDDDDDDDDDILMANFEDSKFFLNMFEDSGSFLVKGEPGFFFRVVYAALVGTRVKVDLTINKTLNPNPNPPLGLTPDYCNSICGLIEAVQWFGTTHSSVRLYLKQSDEPLTSVPRGSSIPLDRTIIVAPVQRPSLLYIDFLLLNSHNESLIEEQLIAFPIKTIPDYSYPPKFITNKLRTHSKHILDGLITVSITFLDD